MKYHELFDITLMISLFSGIYLSGVRRLVRNGYVVNAFVLLTVVPLICTPLFSAAIFLPLFFPGKAIEERLFNILAGVACFSNTFKLFYFYAKREMFEELTRMWDEFSEDVLHPELRKEWLLKKKKATDKWIVVFGGFLVFSAFIFAVAPFFTRKLEHPTAVPYQTDSPLFDVYLVFELISQVYICASVHAYNSLLLQAVALEDGLCQYMKESLAIIMSPVRVNEFGQIILPENGDREDNTPFPKITSSYREICLDTEEQLGRWIRQHQCLIRFHDHLKVLYHPTMCVEFAGLAIIICLVVFMILSNSFGVTMIFISIAYCCNIYTIFYITCYYADLASLGSQTLFEDALAEAWYSFPRKVRVGFRIVILRCKSPLVLFAFKIYPLGSAGFAKIFRHAYSFFMFLIQVMNRTRDRQEY